MNQIGIPQMKRILYFRSALACAILSGVPASAQRAGGPYALDAEVFNGPQARQTAGEAVHAITGVSNPGRAFAAAGPYEMRDSATARRALVLETSLAPDPAPLPEEQSATFTLGFTTDRWGTHVVPPADVELSPVSGPLDAGPFTGQVTARAVYLDSPASVSGTFDLLEAVAVFTVLDSDKDNFGSYAGDGLDDDWQIEHFGFDNPLAAPGLDPDGDGQDNRFEFIAGLVPTDATSRFRFRIDPVPGQPVHRLLRFSPVLPDRTYQIITRTDLSPGTWSPLVGAPQSDTGDERAVTDTTATPARKFYRVEITKNPESP